MGSSIWLSQWTQSAQNSSESVEKRDLYLGVYGAFGLAQGKVNSGVNLVADVVHSVHQ